MVTTAQVAPNVLFFLVDRIWGSLAAEPELVHAGLVHPVDPPLVQEDEENNVISEH